MTDLVTITHTADGVRVCWPDGTVNVFANSVFLAEAYAKSERRREAAYLAFADVGARIDAVEKAANSGELPEAIADLRSSCVAAMQLVK